MSDILRLLIADDEEGVRSAFRDALSPLPAKSSGMAALESELFADAAAPAPVHYDLTVVSQGEDAIAAVAKSIDEGRPFSVVFLDMRMPPGIDGVATAERIRALDAALNIVIVTGYSDVNVPNIAAKILPRDKLFYIAKPFQVAEIQQQARALSARWLHENALVRELQQQNVNLKAAAQEATKARLEAEEASFAKSSFLSNVSHELRTPLNAIIGFSDIMNNQLYGPLGDPRYVDYSKEINVSGSLLLGSINDIIDTARLDLGKVELSFEPVDVYDCVARVAKDLDAFARSKLVTVELPRGHEPLLLSADRKRVHQIVLAVLHNAVKFSPKGGIVQVAVESEDGNVVVSIRDSGPGIAPAAIEAVKGIFAHGDNVFSRARGGLGLGLSLAGRLLDLHKGRMEFSRPAGAGTLVRLYFPTAAAEYRAA
ncbi:MAG: ATP-binding protein [Alphaproteobacteria bacterium]|nr:ATP-binding protein [Alphaproteobacteria bacterium]